MLKHKRRYVSLNALIVCAFLVSPCNADLIGQSTLAPALSVHTSELKSVIGRAFLEESFGGNPTFSPWAPAQEQELRAISREIGQQLGHETFQRRYAKYEYGNTAVPVEVWYWRGETEFYPKVFYFRIGGIFYIHKDAYARLSKPLRRQIKNRVVILENVRDKWNGGRFGDEIVPGCGIMPHDEVFTILSVIQIMQSDFNNITRAIDFGAGDGIRALTALKLGLVNNVDLVRIDKNELFDAKSQLQLNGFSEQKGDFTLHQTDIEDKKSISQMLELYENETLAIFSSVGYWIEAVKWGVDNGNVIRLIRNMANVKLFVAGGSWLPRYSHALKRDTNKSLFDNTEFLIVESQSSIKHDDGSPLLSWSAERVGSRIKQENIFNPKEQTKKKNLPIRKTANIKIIAQAI